MAARDGLIQTINDTMTQNDKKFLISIKQGEPDWVLLPVADIDQFPVIKRKLINMKMDKKKQRGSL